MRWIGNLCLLGILVGCTAHQPQTVEQVYQRHKGLLQAAVTAGVVLPLRQHPEWAQPIAEAAHLAAFQVATQTLGLAEMVAFVQGQLALHLPPDAQAALAVLVPAVQGELNALLASGKLRTPAEVRALATEVLSWIEAAARVAA